MQEQRRVERVESISKKNFFFSATHNSVEDIFFEIVKSISGTEVPVVNPSQSRKTIL